MTIAFEDGKGTLTNDGEEFVINGITILQEAIAANNFEKGWRTAETEMSPASERPISEHVALLHSEVTEIFEAFRNHEPAIWYEYMDPDLKRGLQKWEGPPITISSTGEPVLGKPQGITSELADVVIRALDMADELDLPLVDVLIQKHRYNQTRPYRHGGKKA